MYQVFDVEVLNKVLSFYGKCVARVDTGTVKAKSLKTQSQLLKKLVIVIFANFNR